MTHKVNVGCGQQAQIQMVMVTLNLKGATNYAHRVSYILFVSPIKTNDVIRHTCDNPICVNPNHLLKGTHADNVRDRVSRNRSAKDEFNGRSKLTRTIVEKCRTSNKSYKVLAEEYSVSSSTMRRACVGLTWI